MSDNPDDIRGDLDDRIAELHADAQANYNREPVLTIVRALQDTEQQMKDAGGPSGDFWSGFSQARHEVVSIFLTYSAEVSCDCRDVNRFVAQRQNGEWFCEECGTVLAENTDDVIGQYSRRHSSEE